MRRPAGGRRPDRPAAAGAPGVGAGRAFLAAVCAPTCSSPPSTSRRPSRSRGRRLARAPAAAGRGFAWYRYHQLFRDLLLGQLRERRGPEAERALHARAGAWFAGAGMVEEGVHHLLAAGDPRRAAALVERHVPALLEEEWPAVERWLDLLPPEVVQRRPALLVARARVAQRRGRFDALPARRLRPRQLGELSPRLDTHSPQRGCAGAR